MGMDYTTDFQPLRGNKCGSENVVGASVLSCHLLSI